MKLQVTIDLPEEQIRQLAYNQCGYARENPRACWKLSEYKEAVRLRVEALTRADAIDRLSLIGRST